MTTPTPAATPSTGKTPGRTIRVADDLWRAAQAKATANGETLSDVLRDYLADYVDDRVPGYATGRQAGVRDVLDRLRQSAD